MEMDKTLTPNLFIIGASKAGTTALHTYLDLHPDICMGSAKEPCFFVDPAHLAERWPFMARNPVSYDLDTYLSTFDEGRDAAYRGESSTLYAMHPSIPGVAGRIAAMSPDARIIYMVREPVARTISHYWQETLWLHETRPMAEALSSDSIYKDTSDYALQLEEYLKHFDSCNIHVVVNERMRSDREAVLAEIFDWLGVVPFSPAPADLQDIHVSPSTGRAPRLPGVRAFRDSGLWRRIRRLLPDGAIDVLRRAGSRAVQKTEVDDASVRAELAAHFATRVPRFEEMIGRQVKEWREAG
jgi:hypothetical protein